MPHVRTGISEVPGLFMTHQAGSGRTGLLTSLLADALTAHEGREREKVERK